LEVVQKGEANIEVNKEDPVYDLHPLDGEQGIIICPRQPQEENDSHQIRTTSSFEYISPVSNQF